MRQTDQGEAGAALPPASRGSILRGAPPLVSRVSLY
jgi:hypothetical protein